MEEDSILRVESYCPGGAKCRIVDISPTHFEATDKTRASLCRKLESVLLKRPALSMRYRSQSSGGDCIPHTFPGSCSANPSSQSFWPAIGMQFTTRAATGAFVGRPSI